MNLRYIQLHEHVFEHGRDLLLVTGLRSVSDPSAAGLSLDRRASIALASLVRTPGVHVAMIADRPIGDVMLRCCEVPGAWLIGEAGQTLRDPHGQITRLRHLAGSRRAPSHAVRTVLAQLPRATAALMGVDARLHLPAVAALRARPRTVAFHVEGDGPVPPLDLVDGVVHGSTAWIDLLGRLRSLLAHRSDAVKACC